MVSIVVGALGTSPKGLQKRLEELKIIGRIKTTEATTLRSDRIPRRVLQTRGNLVSLKLQ